MFITTWVNTYMDNHRCWPLIITETQVLMSVSGLFRGVHAIREVHLAWHEVASWWFAGLCCLFSGLSSVLWTHCLLWRNWNSEGTLSSRVWLSLDLSLSLSRSFFLSLPPHWGPVIKQFSSSKWKLVSWTTNNSVAYVSNYIHFILSLNFISLLLLVPVGAKRKSSRRVWADR